MGTRRLEELITIARAEAYSEDYSTTEGWDDNVLAAIANRGLDKLYHAITQIDNPANIQQYTDDVIAGQQAYDLPIDVFMSIRLNDVRFQWGTQTYEFVTLTQGLISDRYSYEINYPQVYAIRNGQIILSPTPNITRNDALIINYQKRMRSVDIRRGLVASKTDSPVTFTLSFISSSSKNANMQTYANTTLDKVDYICLVDTEGDPIVSEIPINNYNSTSQIITAQSDYTIPAVQLAALDAALAASQDVYVVSGRYASTHSELDSQCEDFLIEYMITRLLRLQSNSAEYEEARNREEETLSALVNAYRRYRKTVYPVRWKYKFNRRIYPFGRGIF